MKIGYARVSTDDQHLDLQRAFLQEEGCERIFEEKAAGKSRVRPALRSALAAMREGDVLVVWKLDRLGRTLLHMLEIAQHLESHDMRLQCLHDFVDLKSCTGRFHFQVMGAVAELEIGQISERTIAGVAAARRKGKCLGRPRSISNEQIAQARLLSNCADSPSLAAIAQTIGVKPTTLRRALRHT